MIIISSYRQLSRVFSPLILSSTLILSGCGEETEDSETNAVQKGIVNALANKALNPSMNDRITPIKVAEAMPKSADPLEVVGFEVSTKSYNLTEETSLGFDYFDVDIDYDIRIKYAGSYEGRGKYIKSVTFEPRSIDIDRTAAMTVEALSDVPDKIGTLDNPVAQVRFTLVWTIESKMPMSKKYRKFDIYTVDGDTGKITLQTGEFE